MTKPIPRPKIGKPIQLSGPMAELAHHFGSVTALAEALGVTLRTIQRWDNGDLNPRAPARKLMAVIAKARRLEPPFPTEAA